MINHYCLYDREHNRVHTTRCARVTADARLLAAAVRRRLAGVPAAAGAASSLLLGRWGGACTAGTGACSDAGGAPSPAH